jgi:hypothetical protein
VWVCRFGPLAGKQKFVLVPFFMAFLLISWARSDLAQSWSVPVICAEWSNL